MDHFVPDLFRIAVHWYIYCRFSDRIDYTDSRHHFTRERVDQGEFRMVRVHSRFQHADFLTKPLPRGALYFHRRFAKSWLT